MGTTELWTLDFRLSTAFVRVGVGQSGNSGWKEMVSFFSSWSVAISAELQTRTVTRGAAAENAAPVASC